MLVQLHGRDIMWQKERLLNLALQWVPKTCDKIAWLDCDVIFASAEWVERASQALEEFPLLHLFHERHDLPHHVELDHLRSWDLPPTSQSVVWKIAAGEATAEDLFLAGAPLERRSTAGLAWASRRDVLEKHGLYDACILGTGDRVILCAALGKFAYGARAVLMNARREEHYLAWARPYCDTVQGRVGSIPGRLFHLWHGDLSNRRYQERHRDLEAFHFDPFTDIAVDEQGGWRWNSDKRELHAFVRRYFTSRNEDGAERGATGASGCQSPPRAESAKGIARSQAQQGAPEDRESLLAKGEILTDTQAHPLPPEELARWESDKE